ncbi:importin subunit alpha-4-like [Humulus lupulus]|uniref:importin subunit alpha-4-like n=1 Tax=Humulus lupulus TaxID=3486 RepID=UPI002B41443C|nr:importin subunit alpha-4-like [Humulus lupulus]
MKLRGGSVLGKKKILKSDHFPGCQNKQLSQIDGAPNYRHAESLHVHGAAIPTMEKGSQNAAVLEKRLESIPAMVQGVWSDDSALQLEATTQFRKLLSIEHNPPIDEIIKAGVVPRFVDFLGRNEVPQLQSD